jgi:hypothetical protein
MEKPIDPELLRKMMMGDYAGSSDKKPSEQRKSSTKRKRVQESDLHLSTLQKLPSYRPEVPPLEQQLLFAEEALQQAIKNQCTGLVLIHGHGESVLCDALFRKYKNHKNIERLERLFEPPYSGAALKLHLK